MHIIHCEYRNIQILIRLKVSLWRYFFMINLFGLFHKIWPWRIPNYLRKTMVSYLHELIDLRELEILLTYKPGSRGIIYNFACRFEIYVVILWPSRQLCWLNDDHKKRNGIFTRQNWKWNCYPIGGQLLVYLYCMLMCFFLGYYIMVEYWSPLHKERILLRTLHRYK